MFFSAPSTTTATLKYGVPPMNDERAAVDVTIKANPGEPLSKTYGIEDKIVTIENVRGKEKEFSLDTTGFQFHRHASKHASFEDDSAIRTEYYAESSELIKKLTGASRVVIFDHRVRRRMPGETDSRQPAAEVHVDQTTPASIAHVHRHMPAEDVPKLLAKRFQIINLWRPIENPAFDWPLAFCDYRSVDTKKDMFPVTLIFADREGETYSVTYNKDHRWKYLQGMTPEELVLIKCFDSAQDDGVAAYTPHTAFDDPTTPAGSPPRQSIEVRALVFYD